MTTILLLTVGPIIILLSPIKMSFMLVLISTWVSLMSYTLTTSVFPSCAVLISFSTGIIILFCYCSTLSEYETNTFFTNIAPAILIALTTLGCSTWGEGSLSPINKFLLEISSPALIIIMGLILCSMVSINVTLIDPSKPLISSY